MRRLFYSLAAICLLVTGALAAGGFGAGSNLTGFWQNQTSAQAVVLTRGTCVSSDSNLTTYTFNTTGTGASDADNVLVIAGVVSRDGATTYNVTDVTFDGVSGTELVDEAGSGFVSTAIYAAASLSANNATVNIQVTHSEQVNGAAVCLWALKNLNSTTPVSVVADNDSGSGTLAITLSSTTAGGFVIGISGDESPGDNATWTNMTEVEDADTGDFAFSNADDPSAGGSLAVTVSWTNSNDSSASAVAFR